ncbi:hypothetical protein KVT40_006890 [Elsinoe batatas]|uniref:Uncharacterized protein n=1 Tax=Elsinoe batatas TaxID=2601811 RepID=A0A8K0PH22_9PEZI|nr:hypothetical protein KVT40_006890 [Elsinoe batatas]
MPTTTPSMSSSQSKKRSSPSFTARISRLRLPLAPLLPMPSGPPHPDFPSTLLAYHLLTEDQLDRLAHYYHQSTPGVYTNEYPAPVLWPRRRSSASLLSPRAGEVRRRGSTGSPVTEGRTRALEEALDEEGGEGWLVGLLERVAVDSQLRNGEGVRERRWSAVLRDDDERIAIKRRKIGKFIGLVGMQTPAAEVESRMQHDMERAVRVIRRERRREEERELASRKWR